MEFANIQDVIGNLVPNAYVNRITLESSGTPPIRIDPHIDDETLETQPNSNPPIVTGKQITNDILYIYKFHN